MKLGRSADIEYWIEIFLIVIFVIVCVGSIILLVFLAPRYINASVESQQLTSPIVVSTTTIASSTLLTYPSALPTQTNTPQATSTNLPSATATSFPTFTASFSATPPSPTPTPQFLLDACEKPGWFPKKLKLKDHHIFEYGGYYYIVATDARWRVHHLIYGRSRDFCNWEELPFILQDVESLAWDGMDLWAPFVIKQDGVYFMFYTGVTWNVTQRIMLAATLTPDIPDSWVALGAIFRPTFADVKWNAGGWADCRDPSVLKVDGIYYLYYAASDSVGGVVGVATSQSLLGPWVDQGVILGPEKDISLESPLVVARNGVYYLIYNHTHRGEYYRIGETPIGPWGDPYPLKPGWAHEMWQIGDQADWYTSYLTSYSVTIAPIKWTSSETSPYELPMIDVAKP